MGDFIQTIMALIVVAAIFIGLATFVRLQNRLYCQRNIQLVESGKMSDEELTKSYTMAKKNQDNTMWAIFIFSIFYKYGLKLQQRVFDTYKEAMIKRNLPL